MSDREQTERDRISADIFRLACRIAWHPTATARELATIQKSMTAWLWKRQDAHPVDEVTT